MSFHFTLITWFLLLVPMPFIILMTLVSYICHHRKAGKMPQG